MKIFLPQVDYAQSDFAGTVLQEIFYMWNCNVMAA
jgi:hypothetical protein